ncbi:addiction module antitoxin RelB [Pseudomonas syringae]|uniref:Addiction module antitoxin RelB n=1 Tax=Pseudomonas syringae TaxID=317 RepID=A0A1C7Z063_PSESX|nr:type II toxin-antitoxin system RelE/ParE family toxin [Pseudomonas syringae]OCR23392.1 addiction module antitoxin RelB [Pseudomonas syringae]
MYTIRQTSIFAQWHATLRDIQAKIAIARRIERASAGNLGDVKSVGEGVSEMRVAVGAGYRIYFTTRNRTIIVLLVGGDKSTQPADIKQAKTVAKEV